MKNLALSLSLSTALTLPGCSTAEMQARIKDNAKFASSSCTKSFNESVHKIVDTIESRPYTRCQIHHGGYVTSECVYCSNGKKGHPDFEYVLSCLTEKEDQLRIIDYHTPIEPHQGFYLDNQHKNYDSVVPNPDSIFGFRKRFEPTCKSDDREITVADQLLEVHQLVKKVALQNPHLKQ